MSFHRVKCKCCGGCCTSEDPCTLCQSPNCTPSSIGLTIPAVTINTGCFPCAAIFGGDPGSVKIEGAYAGGTECLLYVGGCRWRLRITPYDTVKVSVYESNDCTGSPCFVSDRLTIELEIYDNGGTIFVRWFVGVDMSTYTPGTCPALPTLPSDYFTIYASSAALSTLPNFCKVGGTLPSLAPGTTVCDTGGDDAHWLTTSTPGNSTATPCCAAEAPLALASTSKGASFEIPPDFDPAAETRRLKSGGCCGAPSVT